LPADDLYMIEEIASLDAVLEAQAVAIGEGFWQPFKAAGRDRKVQWRLFLGSIMFMWQNGSGINAINYYRYVITEHLLSDKLLTICSTQPSRVRIDRHSWH
jgi:hypothetical protein